MDYTITVYQIYGGTEGNIGVIEYNDNYHTINCEGYIETKTLKGIIKFLNYLFIKKHGKGIFDFSSKSSFIYQLNKDKKYRLEIEEKKENIFRVSPFRETRLRLNKDVKEWINKPPSSKDWEEYVELRKSIFVSKYCRYFQHKRDQILAERVCDEYFMLMKKRIVELYKQGQTIENIISYFAVRHTVNNPVQIFFELVGFEKDEHLLENIHLVDIDVGPFKKVVFKSSSGEVFQVAWGYETVSDLSKKGYAEYLEEMKMLKKAIKQMED